MDELNEQLTAATTRLAAAAEALENAISRFDAQHQELNAKVDRIVAAIDDSIAVRPEPGEPAAEAGELKSRVAELERANQELKAQAARASRKTLPPLVSALLAKDTAGDALDSAALDKALHSLSLEQRIAVKAEMARAGLLE
jgi:Skp family chaperone for outer membrane proteins